MTFGDDDLIILEHNEKEAKIQITIKKMHNKKNFKYLKN